MNLFEHHNFGEREGKEKEDSLLNLFNRQYYKINNLITYNGYNFQIQILHIM